MLPEWLSQNNATNCPCCEISISKKTNYLNKTIKATRNFMNETFLQEANANKNGLLQAADARLKLVASVILIVLLSITHIILPVIIVYLSVLVLAYFSKLGLKDFIFRPLFTVGFFSLLIMLPATLNLFIAGRAIIILPANLAITDNGLRFLILFSLRSLTMTSAALLLLLTTKREEFLQSLKTLRIPTAFQMIISMSYRFIAILVRIIENLHLAKKSRTIKTDNTKEERKWVASRIAWTFTKAIDISNEVTLAMISRGWQGE